MSIPAHLQKRFNEAHKSARVALINEDHQSYLRAVRKLRRVLGDARAFLQEITP